MLKSEVNNRSFDCEHLVETDRQHETDNVYQQNHAFNQEKEQIKTQELISNVDTNSACELNHNTMSSSGNKYLTSDFDIKREKCGSLKSGLSLRPWESKREMLEYAMKTEPWAKRVCFKHHKILALS